jgi:hypothetical protein
MEEIVEFRGRDISWVEEWREFKMRCARNVSQWQMDAMVLGQ